MSECSYSHLTPTKELSSRSSVSESPSDPYRSQYDRDRDRILHSDSFRRLNHKTQVVLDAQNDHFRTRLTHSLEVSQIARTISRYFKLDESLTEAISLAHDIGHPPFGHAGEKALNETISQYKESSFDHNDQTIKTICFLETRYFNKDSFGLDLTFACIEGIAKHQGKINEEQEKKLPNFIRWYEQQKAPPFELKTQGSLEAQIAAISDDVAYICHDLDDALRFNDIDNITIEKIVEWPMVKEAMESLYQKTNNQNIVKKRHPLTRRLIHMMVSDVIDTTKINIHENNIKTYQDIIDQEKPMVNFSSHYQAEIKELKEKLRQGYWKHEYISNQEKLFTDMIKRLFHLYLEYPQCISKETVGESEFYHPDIDKIDDPEYLPTIVLDYIAGMTDRFAVRQFAELIKHDQFPDSELLERIAKLYTI